VTATPAGVPDGTGQIVAAGSASGSIYDLGYRRYTGPRLGRRHAVAALLRHGIRSAYGLGRPGRTKIIPMGLAVLAALPAVVALGVAALASQTGATNQLDEASPIRYETYWQAIAQLLALFVAAQAPELITRDIRWRVLALYFTRALRRDDYALAKVGALIVALVVFILGPQLLIFVGRSLVSSDIPGSISKDLPKLPPVIVQTGLAACLLAALGVAIASFTPRRAYATVAIIAVFTVPPIVTAAAARIIDRDLASLLTLLSPIDILDGTNAYLFGLEVPDTVIRVDLWWYPIAALVWIVVALGVMLWRYRRIEP